MNTLIRFGAIATLALAATTGMPANAGDPDQWALVAATDDGVASMWLVRQDNDRPSILTLQEHIEIDETHAHEGFGYRRFTDFDCRAGTLERGAVTAYAAESDEERDTTIARMRGVPLPEWDDAPIRPQAGTYEERVLRLACAYAAGDPQFAKLPRLDRPFYRADADRAMAAAEPGFKPRTYQGLAMPLVRTGVFGITSVAREPSRRAATARLEAQCRANGWDCETMVSHQCIATAYNEAELAYFVGVGATAAQAIEQARGHCRGNGVDCPLTMDRCP